MNTICPLKLKKGDVLIEHLLEKKKLLAKNDPTHRKFKTALVIEGGFMFGVYGAGVVIGLERLGLTDAFDYVIGNSAGAGIGAYFVAGQAELGTSIFYEDLTDKRFINYFRFKKVVNFDYLEEVMRNVKSLNISEIHNSRIQLYISVTNASTGRGELLDMKDPNIDIVDAIIASCCLPKLYEKSIFINGKHYYDGMIGFPYSIEYVIRELKCTDVLVITNRDCNCRKESIFPPYFELAANETVFRKSKIRYALSNKEKHYSHDMSILWDEEPIGKVNLGLICRNKLPINPFTQNAELLKETALDAKEQVINLFTL